MKISNNTKFFLNIFSVVLIVYGISAIPALLAAAYFEEQASVLVLAIASSVCIVAGIAIRRLFDMNASTIRPRINFMTTTISWLAIIVITTFVYFFGQAEFTLIDSFFKATASLTTTGISSPANSVYPLSLQLFSSMLNWLGGIGIILISVSCISTVDFSRHALISVEIPGPEFLKSSISFKQSYGYIVFTYIILTAVHFIALCLAGMPVFTSVLTALSNISTAGLQHISNGVITNLPLAQKIIITIFAFLGSVNISFVILLFIHKARLIKNHTEIRIYTGRILITALIIAAAVTVLNHQSFIRSLGDALMQTVAFLSTSGYVIADCSRWPLFCELLILLQMFVGACAFSTGGGIKTSRIAIGMKTAKFGLFRQVHPNAVRPVKFDDEALRSVHLVQANLFISLFMAIFIISAMIISLDNKNESIFDALNYSQAMITNTGTSIAELGVSGPAPDFSPLSKVVMSVEMLCGRLEIYPVLMLFFRSFWKSDSNR